MGYKLGTVAFYYNRLAEPAVNGICILLTPSGPGGGKRPPRIFTCRDGCSNRGAASSLSRIRRRWTKSSIFFRCTFSCCVSEMVEKHFGSARDGGG